MTRSGMRLPELPAGPVWWYTSDARAFIEITLQPGQPIRAIEVQQIERAGLHGVLVFLMRPTGELDMVVTPGFDFDRAWFDSNPFTAHLKFGSIVTAKFRSAHCRITPNEVDVGVDVDDASGRRIEITIRHRFARPGAPWFVPATRQQQSPRTLRFMLSNSFRLLPRRATELVATIDGTPLHPGFFMLPRTLAPYFNVRCGSGLVGAGLNESGSWSIPEPRDLRFPDQITAPTAAGSLQISFVRDSDQAQAGRFTVSAPIGVLATGRWSDSDAASGRQFMLTDVAQNWFPGWRDPLGLLLYLLRRFRRRNESWRWEATVGTGANGREMTGTWCDH